MEIEIDCERSFKTLQTRHKWPRGRGSGITGCQMGEGGWVGWGRPLIGARVQHIATIRCLHRCCHRIGNCD